MAQRSMGICSTFANLAPDKCLRSSMQNMGGSAGFSGEAEVKCRRGAVGLAAKISFSRPSAQRRWKMTVSRLG